MSKQDNGPRYVAKPYLDGESFMIMDRGRMIASALSREQVDLIVPALNACDGMEATIAERQGIIDELRRERNNVDRAILRVYAKCEASESEVHSPMGMLDIIGKTIEGTSAACEDLHATIASLQAENARWRDAQADMAMLIRRIAKGRSTDAQCAAMDYLARTGQAGSLLRNNTESEADNGDA